MRRAGTPERRRRLPERGGNPCEVPGGAALRLAAHPSIFFTLSQPPKDDKKKKDAGKSAKKDKDPVNKSGGKAKKKVRASGTKGSERSPGLARVQRGWAPRAA